MKNEPPATQAPQPTPPNRVLRFWLYVAGLVATLWVSAFLFQYVPPNYLLPAIVTAAVPCFACFIGACAQQS